MQREWWLRALLVLQAPRSVFTAMRAQDGESVAARQEPALAVAFLASLASVLSTPRFATLLDEPEVDTIVLPVFALVAAAAYAFVAVFVLAAVLRAAVALLGGATTAPGARHLVSFALAPLALSLLVLWPLRLALYGGDVFRRGGRDGGVDGSAFALAELASALWALVLLVVGVRLVVRLDWLRSLLASAPVAALAALAAGVERFV